ncbi:MAG: hypothetical protein ABIH00_00640, partial [Armatimonadota bacterium]
MGVGQTGSGDIFGVGYTNKAKEYRDFSDPKLRSEADKLISDLMKDSKINRPALEKKVSAFLDNHKESKFFAEIKQKLFLKLQKEIKNQRALSKGSGDTNTADKVSKLYVITNIVRDIIK